MYKSTNLLLSNIHSKAEKVLKKREVLTVVSKSYGGEKKGSPEASTEKRTVRISKSHSVTKLAKENVSKVQNIYKAFAWVQMSPCSLIHDYFPEDTQNTNTAFDSQSRMYYMYF